MPSAKASILPTRKALPANSKSKRGGNNGSNEEETQDPASLVKSRKFGIKLQTKKTPPAAGEFEDAAPFWKAAKESLTQEGDNDDSTDGNNEDTQKLVREQRREQRAEQKNVSNKASRETLRAQYEEDRNNLKSPDFSLDASTGSASDIVARNVVGGRAKNLNSSRSFRSRRKKPKKSPTESPIALFSPSEVSNVSTVAATHISTPASLRTVHSFPLSSSKSKGDTSRRKSETPLSDLKGRVLLQGMHSAMRRDTVQPRSIAEEEDSVESVEKVGNMDMTKILKNDDVINEEEANMDDNDLFPLDMEGGQGSFMTNDDGDDSNNNDDNLILKESKSNDRSSLSRAAGLLPTHVEENDKDQESNSVRDTKQAIVERISSPSKAGEGTSEFEEEHFNDDPGGEGYELPSDQESPPLQQEEESSRSVTFSKKSSLHDDNELYSEEEVLITKDGADANLKEKEDSETELNGNRSDNVDTTTAVTPDERQGKKRSRKRVTYARETFGYPAGNRDYKTIPVQDFVDSDENDGGHRPRRSKRVKVAPLEFWKNEKFVYEPNDETGRLGRILGDMPVVSGICMALPTPYKKRKLHQNDDGSERKKARKEAKAKKVEISNEEFKPYNAIKLRKKYNFSDDHYANTWHEPTQQVELQKLIARKEEMQGVDLPKGKRSKGESSIVGKAAQAFKVKEEPAMPGYIMGNLILPPQGIKDQEGVGRCSQGFNVGDCQPQSIEVAIADPDINDGKFDAPTAQRFLLSKGDMFHIPAGNVYRIQNHSRTIGCTLYWTIIRPVRSLLENELKKN